MDLYAIDYVSVSGRSWLHRLPAGAKMVALVLLLAVLLPTRVATVPAAALAGLVLLAWSARIPMRLFLLLMLYPLLFLAVLMASLSAVSAPAVMLVMARVLAITAAVVLFLLTTSFPALFALLGRVLPGFLVAALFFTYRSLFLIARGVANVRTALHLRGGVDWRHPIASLRNLGMALGHLLVHVIDSAERMADSLRVRGFANRIYFLGDQHE